MVYPGDHQRLQRSAEKLFPQPITSLDEILEQAADMQEENKEVLEAVLSTSPKYRDVVYLHYYEGYTAPQIGRLLGKNVNRVHTLMTRSRHLPRDKLGGDVDA